MVPIDETAIANTVIAQDFAFALKGNSEPSSRTPIYCDNCEVVEVTRVIDADTLDTSIGRVQLFGADAPERGEVCWGESLSMMQSIISKLVRLEYGPPLGDEFKTHQAYVYDSFGNSLDYQMISSGFATARLRDRVQLPGPHQGELIDLQKISQNAASGCLWKDFIVPTLAPTLVPTEDPDAILEMTATVAAAQTAEAQPPTATPGPTAEPLPTTTPVPTPVPRISLSLGSTPFGFANGSTQLSGAKVIFDGDVGVISVQVRWEPGKPFFSVTVVQATGEIVAGNVYQSVGLYVVTVKASTDEGDTATATINALVN